MTIATEVHAPKTPTELVRAHQAGIWRYLRYLGASESEADDVRQETLIELMKRPFEQRSDRETFGYLRYIARHQFLRMRQRAGRMIPLGELEVADEVWDRLASDGGDMLLDALGECLEHVNGRARQAIDLRYRQGLSREAIAKHLELKPDGVKTLLRLTRAALRECVERKVDS